MCIFSDILSMNESYISGLQTQIISCISIRFKGVVLKIGRYKREFTLVAKRGNLQTYMAHLSPETFLLHCYTFHTSDICDICLSSAAYVTCFTRAWWLHQMETFFPRYWPFVRGGKWRGALMFSLICAWINGRVNNREAGDFRRHRAHHDVTVMMSEPSLISNHISQGYQEELQ